MTWRRNERRDGDGGGSQRGKGEGEGLPLRKSEGEAYPRRDGDRAGGGVDDNGVETGGKPAYPTPQNGGLGDQLKG